MSENCFQQESEFILLRKKTRLQPPLPPKDDLTRPDTWEWLQMKSTQLLQDSVLNGIWVSAEYPICIIFANSAGIRRCSHCRNTVGRLFGIPQLWWSQYCQDSNGFFGYDEQKNSDDIAIINSWARFEIKLLNKEMQYKWVQLTVYIQFLTSSNQTALLVVGTEPSITQHVRESFVNTRAYQHSDPFWAYDVLVQEVVRLEDVAVRGVRDHVRAIEISSKPHGQSDRDYRYLHDVARHAIHVTESLEVALNTLDAMLLQQSAIKQKQTESRLRTWSSLEHRLRFCRNILQNLRCRSNANEKRLSNEIQLNFHMVAQYDAATSVEIARAARTDSAIMKTIATVTMVFLPPMFVSAMFSMSFFSFDSDVGWEISEKYWIFWAFAVPTMLTTYALCFYLQKVAGKEHKVGPNL